MALSVEEFISVQALSLPFSVPIYGSRLKSLALILAKTFLFFFFPAFCANSSLKSPLQTIREASILKG